MIESTLMPSTSAWRARNFSRSTWYATICCALTGSQFSGIKGEHQVAFAAVLGQAELLFSRPRSELEDRNRAPCRRPATTSSPHNHVGDTRRRFEVVICLN